MASVRSEDGAGTTNFKVFGLTLNTKAVVEELTSKEMERIYFGWE